MIARSWLLFVLLVLLDRLAAAQDLGTTVLLNDTNYVFYSVAGILESFESLTTQNDIEMSGAFLSTCGSFLALYATGSSAGMLFTGTAITVNVLYDESSGGTFNIYIDGELNQQPSSLSNIQLLSPCTGPSVQITSLQDGTHNVTVENFVGGTQQIMLQSFFLPPGNVPLSSSAPQTTSSVTSAFPSSSTGANTSISSTMSRSSTTHSTAASTETGASALEPHTAKKGSALVGVIVAILVVLVGVGVLFFIIKRRRRHRDNGHRTDLLEEEKRGPRDTRATFPDLPNPFGSPQQMSTTSIVSTAPSSAPLNATTGLRAYQTSTQAQYQYRPHVYPPSISSATASIAMTSSAQSSQYERVHSHSDSLSFAAPPQSRSSGSQSGRASASRAQSLAVHNPNPNNPGGGDIKRPGYFGVNEATPPIESSNQVDLIQQVVTQTMMTMMAARGPVHVSGGDTGQGSPLLQVDDAPPPQYEAWRAR